MPLYFCCYFDNGIADDAKFLKFEQETVLMNAAVKYEDTIQRPQA